MVKLMNKNQLICPLCQNNNNCGINNSETCWCMTKEVPNALIEEVPLTQIDKTCICVNCIDGYNKRIEEQTKKVTQP